MNAFLRFPSHAFFKAVVPLVLLALLPPCFPVHADNTHTATLNETAIGNVTFSGSPAGTDNLTVPITPFISNFGHYRTQMI